MNFARFVVVTGLSGAGKSQAMKSFEDLGFTCSDQLPPALASAFVALADRAHVERVALSLDARVAGPFGDALDAIDALDRDLALDVLFLDAADDVLVRRYSETRRRHPYAAAGGLAGAIASERLALAPLRARATHVWDTSTMTHGALTLRIAQTYGDAATTRRLAVRVVAFGYKHGLPLDTDLVIDVRFFPNPNYEPRLKARTGLDDDVVAFMEALDDTAPFLERLYAFVDFLIPRYVREARSRLTIGIGCTGGRHRSVFIASRLAAHLDDRPELDVALDFRELANA